MTARTTTIGRFDRIVAVCFGVISVCAALGIGFLLCLAIIEASRLFHSGGQPHDGWTRFSIFLGVKLVLAVCLLVLGVRSLRGTRVI